MSETLARVRNLEQFIEKHGDDALISRSIAKMLSYKIQQYKEEIRKLDKDLGKFERAHRMESPEFFAAFMDGRLGDDLDLVEWSALYQMRRRLVDKKDELQNV